MFPLDMIQDPVAAGGWVRDKYGANLNRDEFHSIFYSEVVISQYMRSLDTGAVPPRWAYLAKFAADPTDTACDTIPPGIAEEAE